jgi:hypothetical protein
LRLRAASRILARVSGRMETVGSPFRTREAIDVPTPAACATSASLAVRPVRVGAAICGGLAEI